MNPCDDRYVDESKYQTGTTIQEEWRYLHWLRKQGSGYEIDIEVVEERVQRMMKASFDLEISKIGNYGR